MKTTQREWTIQQLKEHGEVTRNQALSVYFSRLGAVVCDLRSEGWDIESVKRDGDWVYKLVDTPVEPPKETFYVRHPITGERITSEQLRAL